MPQTSAADTQTARRLLQVFQRVTAIRLHRHLQRKPIISITEAPRALTISAPTAAKALATLETRSIVR